MLRFRVQVQQLTQAARPSGGTLLVVLFPVLRYEMRLYGLFEIPKAAEAWADNDTDEIHDDPSAEIALVVHMFY